MPNRNLSKLHGTLLLLNEEQQSFADAQILLLQAIHECGSISKAAKQIGISYKTAWDRIDAMNNMSGQPLVVRSVGGAQGGGTALTSLGKQTVAGFIAVQAELDAFIQRIGAQLHSIEDLANFV
ncbi:MAG: winged helix-turn-helix domain-containing protein, partial [Ketobacter sp.]